MPSTVNGIGTSYVGSSKPLERVGRCARCGFEGVLKSYDTRLWLVFVYLPVLPLGRRRILDLCPSCTAHRAVPYGAWVDLKKKTLEEGMRNLLTKPGDAEAIIDLHQTCLFFGDAAAALRVQELMDKGFSGDARVQQYLGDALTYLSRREEANRYYARAHELDPALPHAREAVAADLASQGKLEEARAMIDPDKCGPDALTALAEANLRAGRPKEAAELYGRAVRRFPGVAQDPALRKKVLAAEAAAGVAKTQLPPKAFVLKPAWVFGGLAAIALVVAVAINHNIASRRTLHVVNGLGEAVDVTIGAQRVNVASGGCERVTLPEGRHTAVVESPVGATHEFVIEAGWFQRFADRRVFVLNVAASAALVHEATVYSARTEDAGGFYRVLHGKPYYEFENVDYAFEAFPSKITVRDRNQRQTKTRVGLLDDAIVDAVHKLAQWTDVAGALALAEWHLDRRPEDRDVLTTYASLARQARMADRATAFLRTAAARRPVVVEAHRLYQEFASRSAAVGEARLIEEYDAASRAEPGNSALIYLRGRLCARVSEAAGHFERAIAADATNAWAHFALGFVASGRGEWVQARGLVTRALELQPTNQEFRQRLFQLRRGSGETDTLEKDLRAFLVEAPLSGFHRLLLAETLVATGRREESLALCEQLRDEIKRAYGTDPPGLVDPVRAQVFYALGDFVEMEKLASADNPNLQGLRVHALVELGRAKEALAIVPFVTSDEDLDPYYFLALAVALAHEGHAAESVEVRDKALERLRAGRSEDEMAAELISRAGAVSVEEGMDVDLDARPKSILLTALGQIRPERAKEFFEAAEKLNTLRTFPYHLLRRVAQGMK